MNVYNKHDETVLTSAKRSTKTYTSSYLLHMIPLCRVKLKTINIINFKHFQNK